MIVLHDNSGSSNVIGSSRLHGIFTITEGLTPWPGHLNWNSSVFQAFMSFSGTVNFAGKSLFSWFVRSQFYTFLIKSVIHGITLEFDFRRILQLKPPIFIFIHPLPVVLSCTIWSHRIKARIRKNETNFLFHFFPLVEVENECLINFAAEFLDITVYF